MTKRLLPSLCLVALCGCTSYVHSRERKSDGSVVEKTSLHAPFLTKQALEKMSSREYENTYTNGTYKYARTLGVQGITNEADSNGIDSLGNLLEKVAKGAASGAGKAVVP